MCLLCPKTRVYASSVQAVYNEFVHVFFCSFIGHKEFRFILPGVSLAMCYCGLFLNQLNQHPVQKVHKGTSRSPENRCNRAALCLLFLAVTNIPVALYTCVVHQRGTIDVMEYVREESRKADKELSVLFLMPCHSTPFHRSVDI